MKTTMAATAPSSHKKFEVAYPVGDRRYSEVLVDRFLAGQSLVGIGAGSREKFRRTA